MASHQLHDEIAELPWISLSGIVAEHGAQESRILGPKTSLAFILGQLIQMMSVTGWERVGHVLASAATPLHFSEVAARDEIESAAK